MPLTIQEAFLDTLDVLDTRDIELVLDPDNCPRELLGHLAYFIGARTYTTILGEDYERQSIKDDLEIRSYIGSEEAANIFARNAQVLHTLQYERGGSPESLLRIVICVNAHTREVDGELIDFLSFLVRTYKSLFWESIEVNRVDVCPAFELDIGWVGRLHTTVYYISE